MNLNNQRMIFVWYKSH